MSTQTAVVVGATGLIGEAVARRLATDPAIGRIRLLVRREPVYELPKTEIMRVDFDDPGTLNDHMGAGDALFCCVGTTRAKVKGDQAAYRKVDHDIPLNCGRIALRNGFRQLLLVSSVGANANSSNFYLRLKGETENALEALGFPYLHIFRPSILLGSRKESRTMERVAQAIITPLSGIFAGRFSRYRPIQASMVAEAMVNAATSTLNGSSQTLIYHYSEMKKLNNLQAPRL